jgi:hypothetical protein
MALQAITVNNLRFRSSGDVSGVVLRGTVGQLVPLRRREYRDGVVLNWTLVDETGDSIRVFLHDEWARGLSFVADGDVVSIRQAFTLVPSPDATTALLSQAQRDVRATLGGSAHELLLCPAVATEVVVEQAAEHGDTLELKVTASNLDEPEVRVKRKATAALVLAHHDVSSLTKARRTVDVAEGAEAPSAAAVTD